MKSPSPGSKCISEIVAYLATVRLALVFLIILVGSAVSAAQDGRTLYNHIKAFSLTGGKAEVKDLVLKRDRVEMTFTGTFYFAAPLGGETSGAVFVGQGSFRAQVPPDDFEKAQVKRLLGVDEAIESDFKTVVLRFSDDTIDVIGRSPGAGIGADRCTGLGVRDRCKNTEGNRGKHLVETGSFDTE
jgi:hypothetical protein